LRCSIGRWISHCSRSGHCYSEPCQKHAHRNMRPHHQYFQSTHLPMPTTHTKAAPQLQIAAKTITTGHRRFPNPAQHTLPARYHMQQPATCPNCTTSYTNLNLLPHKARPFPIRTQMNPTRARCHTVSLPPPNIQLDMKRTRLVFAQVPVSLLRAQISLFGVPTNRMLRERARSRLPRLNWIKA
jgi:hypothetical protein